MTERWVSQTRKFCEYCNCWYADNKVSVDNHERGASHQANVRRKLDEVQKRENERLSDEKKLQIELDRIEALAMKSLEEDAKRDPFARDELNRLKEAKAGKVTGPSYRISR